MTLSICRRITDLRVKLAPSAATVFYVYVGVVKMSIALFNIRLTSLTTWFWKTINWAFLVLCTAYTFVALFLNVFKYPLQQMKPTLLRQIHTTLNMLIPKPWTGSDPFCSLTLAFRIAVSLPTWSV